jgi:hypothetical protein
LSKIEHTWQSSTPPAPDVYTTRRNQSKYLTLRYWDGQSWFEIAHGKSRGGSPFTWPKPSRSKRPNWVVKYKGLLYLRKISAYLGEIQWGEPFKVFDEKEVLAHLVKTGVLPADWKTAYQAEMRPSKTVKMTKYLGRKNLKTIKAQCDALGLEFDDRLYQTQGSDFVAIRSFKGDPMLGQVLYNVLNGRFFGSKPDGTRFNSDSATHEGEAWFQTLLDFFYIGKQKA